MELQNGYKIIYNAPERVNEDLPNQVYGSKTIPSINDAMLICYNNGLSTTVDIKSFNLIYSDGTHLFGSVSGIPDASNDINIVVATADSEIVFGEIIDTVENNAETIEDTTNASDNDATGDNK